MQIGYILKTLRNNKGLKQTELAEALGTEQGRISRLESGSPCNVDEVVSIARFFNVSTDYLLGITENQTAVDTDEGKFIRNMCEYTGLNEKTISRLNKCKKRKDETKLLEDLYSKLDLSKMFNIMCDNDIFINMFCSNFLNYLDDEKTNEIKEKLWFDGDIMLGVDVSSMFLVNIQQNIADLKTEKWQLKDRERYTDHTVTYTLKTKPLKDYSDKIIKPSKDGEPNGND